MAELVASLESELKQLGASNEGLVRDNKGVHNVLRAKDKELDAAASKVAEAVASEMRCKVCTLVAAQSILHKVRAGPFEGPLQHALFSTREVWSILRARSCWRLISLRHGGRASLRVALAVTLLTPTQALMCLLIEQTLSSL